MRIIDRTEAGSPWWSRMGLEALAKTLPLETVQRVLRETDRQSQRMRALPAPVMVYFVVALALYRREDYREVLRQLREGLPFPAGMEALPQTPGRSALCQARGRLGEAPLKQLFEQVARPLASPQTQGAFYRGLRLMSLDGFTVPVAQTPKNQEYFGLAYPKESRSTNPQVRLAALAETGTHAVVAVEIGPYRTGELTLARKLFSHLGPGMLCLADRYFAGFELWQQGVQSQTALLWRLRKDVHLAVEQILPDGSYLSRLYPDRQQGSPRPQEGIAVRVIEYCIEEDPQAEPLYRLLTTLLDPEQAPAAELAQLYQERWEIESVFDELKTHLREDKPVLRSQSPELVRQELYGFLLAHFSVRALMHEAAERAHCDPDRLSFVHTLRVVRRTAPRFAAFPPGAVAAPLPSAPERDPGGAAAAAKTAPLRPGGQTQAAQVPDQETH